MTQTNKYVNVETETIGFISERIEAQTNEYVGYLSKCIELDEALLHTLTQELPELMFSRAFKNEAVKRIEHLADGIAFEKAFLLYLTIGKLEAWSFDPANPDATKFLPAGTLAKLAAQRQNFAQVARRAVAPPS
jgi:hypothetical protein